MVKPIGLSHDRYHPPTIVKLVIWRGSVKSKESIFSGLREALVYARGILDREDDSLSGPINVHGSGLSAKPAYRSEGPLLNER